MQLAGHWRDGSLLGAQFSKEPTAFDECARSMSRN